MHQGLSKEERLRKKMCQICLWIYVFGFFIDIKKIMRSGHDEIFGDQKSRTVFPCFLFCFGVDKCCDKFSKSIVRMDGTVMNHFSIVSYSDHSFFDVLMFLILSQRWIFWFTSDFLFWNNGIWLCNQWCDFWKLFASFKVLFFFLWLSIFFQLVTIWLFFHLWLHV